jgi:hypothetical protein
MVNTCNIHGGVFEDQDGCPAGTLPPRHVRTKSSAGLFDMNQQSQIIEFIWNEPWPMFDVTCISGCDVLCREWFVCREHIQLHPGGEIIDY